MYAIIEDSGSQIKVNQGDVVRVALRDLPADKATLSFDKVLLVGDPAQEGTLKVGQPYVSGAKVTADILSQEKTDKVVSFRFRKRKNVLKRRGHRQDYLKVKITAIVA